MNKETTVLLKLITTCLLLITFSITGCANTNGPNAGEKSGPITMQNEGKRVPNEYLVKLTENASEDDLRVVFAELGVQAIRDLTKNRFLITLEKDPGPDAVKSLGAASPFVELVQPNYIYQTQ